MKPEKIPEDYWTFWDNKRREFNDGRPEMPKDLPITDKPIYDPPWIWSPSSNNYVYNVMNWSRLMVSGPIAEEFLYDGKIKNV